MTNQNQNKKPDGNDKNKFKFNSGGNNTLWIFIAVAAGFFLLQMFSGQETAKEINRLRFENKMLKQKDVQKVNVVNEKRVEVFIKESSLSKPEYQDIEQSSGGMFGAESPHYFFNIGSVETFERRMEELQADFPQGEKVPVNFETRTDYMKEIWGWLLPLAIIILIWVFIFRRMSGGGQAGGIFNVGKSKAKLFDQEQSKVKVNFSHVAGLEEAKIEVAEVVDFLKKPDKYTELGGKIPKGALLIGPPGTGKTLLAKAVAGEANVPFFSISGSDFVEMFVGVGASRVRDLFSKAKQKAPCIVFIDEIDAIGRARGKGMSMGSNDERENTLNQLLTEMDGFDTNTGVIILAATNRADVLDPALMRAGRFDRQIHVELPDLTEREEIFTVHIGPLKLGKDVDIAKLAKQTPGFSGADIANVCNEAALIAARKEKKLVEKQDFLDAIDRIIGGLEKKSKIITESEKRTISYHEAGHATVSWLLEHANPLVKVTIVPRGKALGAAWYTPHERQITTKEQLEDQMCAMLGGRAAEEIFFNKISTGALNDLERTTKQAYAMISYFGMSEAVGNLSFFDSSGNNQYNFQKPFSEKTAELIDKEAKALIEQQYKRARKIIEDNTEGLERLALKLLEDEVIFREDAEQILGPRKWDDEYEKEVEKLREQNIKRLNKEKSKREEKARKEEAEKAAAEKKQQDNGKKNDKK
jgi:cell division protease FtsH